MVPGSDPDEQLEMDGKLLGHRWTGDSSVTVMYKPALLVPLSFPVTFTSPRPGSIEIRPLGFAYT